MACEARPPQPGEPLRWLCSSRDDLRSRALTVLLGTLLGSRVHGTARKDDTRDDLLAIHPIDGDTSPERRFVVSPASAAQTLAGAMVGGTAASTLRFVSIEQVASQVREDLHAAARVLRGCGGASRTADVEVFARLCAELRTRGRPAEAEVVRAAAELLAKGQAPPPHLEHEARVALSALGEPLRIPEAEAGTPSRAPFKHRHVLVADDDGYPAECVAYLEARGYVVQVVSDPDEAAEIISADPADILLCDMTWGFDPSAGPRLMELAATEGAFKFIVALSGAPVAPREAPHAGAICAGPQAKTEVGARQFHELVARWARD